MHLDLCLLSSFCAETIEKLGLIKDWWLLMSSFDWNWEPTEFLFLLIIKTLSVLSPPPSALALFSCWENYGLNWKFKGPCCLVIAQEVPISRKPVLAVLIRYAWQQVFREAYSLRNDCVSVGLNSFSFLRGQRRTDTHAWRTSG